MVTHTKNERGQHIYYGYDVQHNIAKKQDKKSTSCTVYIPPEWNGKKVVVIRLE